MLRLVLISLTLGSCKEDSALSSSDPGSLDYSQLDAVFPESKALLTEDFLSFIPGDIELLQFRTYIEETELFLEKKKTHNQEEIDDVLKWHGNLYPGEILLETREEFAEKDPALDEIIHRYFIDDDWRCTRQ